MLCRHISKDKALCPVFVLLGSAIHTSERDLPQCPLVCPVHPSEPCVCMCLCMYIQWTHKSDVKCTDADRQWVHISHSHASIHMGVWFVCAYVHTDTPCTHRHRPHNINHSWSMAYFWKGSTTMSLGLSSPSFRTLRSEPSVLTTSTVLLMSSTQYSRLVTQSRARPSGELIPSDTITSTFDISCREAFFSVLLCNSNQYICVEGGDG